MQSISQLLTLVDAYRSARGISDARVSTLVFNDGGRVAQLRSGKDIGTKLLARTVQWFSDNWPENGNWPADISRPIAAPHAHEAAE